MHFALYSRKKRNMLLGSIVWFVYGTAHYDILVKIYRDLAVNRKLCIIQKLSVLIVKCALSPSWLRMNLCKNCISQNGYDCAVYRFITLVGILYQ